MLVHKSAISLGSNIGDSLTNLAAAIAELVTIAGIELIAQSSWYRTKAVGPPQPDYINGCIILQLTMTPQQLIETLLATEQKFGRVRQERWGPRSLDLDILLYDDLIINAPNLQIPHPRMHERAFVLVPLAEIAPDWLEPVSGLTVAELVKKVDCSDVHLLKGS
ncbi:2-amino-4-hydroxy-6-hydroxymethyldihydropteridine diphosphokinase [Aliinostoc sp. HNIBRCY26]|uniref:2-amino-4-hydroxy-6- hydroxymethyldihydropteridine diphosphokinase n=1 Tax=Aliinostoc sp. HNIBRCY26 TaxID=3418997 RepID=UPI003D01DB71